MVRLRRKGKLRCYLNGSYSQMSRLPCLLEYRPLRVNGLGHHDFYPPCVPVNNDNPYWYVKMQELEIYLKMPLRLIQGKYK